MSLSAENERKLATLESAKRARQYMALGQRMTHSGTSNAELQNTISHAKSARNTVQANPYLSAQNRSQNLDTGMAAQRALEHRHKEHQADWRRLAAKHNSAMSRQRARKGSGLKGAGKRKSKRR